MENLNKILNGEVIVQYSSTLRIKILNEKIFEYKCNNCGINEWNNKKLTLEIEHKDGDNWNNKKENLELLCPNCHSQTPTYRKRKNIKPNKKNYTEEELIIKIKEGKNINQILNSLNLDNSGGNYKRIEKLIRKYNIYLPEKVDKAIQQQEIIKENTKIRIKEFEYKINLVKNSNIDFNKRGWGVKLGKLLGLTPFGAMNWLKKNIPQFYENCWKHNK